MSYDRTYKQTDRQTEITTLYIYIEYLSIIDPTLSFSAFTLIFYKIYIHNK